MIKNDLPGLSTLFFLTLLLFSGYSLAAQSDTGRPPNLLIILIDDLGYGDLASYGHPIVQTPNIDQLAAEGVKLTQYYAPAPLCSPSRAGLLTGRTPYRTGVRSWIPDGQDVHIGENEITIAHLLGQQEYATAVMGKLHLNGGAQMASHPQAADLGFDHSFVIPGGWAKNRKVETRPADGTVFGLDWLPALAEMMHFAVPADRVIDGQSMVNTLTGGEIDRVNPMVWTIDMPGEDDPVNEWAIRDGDWKLILDQGEQPEFLFNIASDPYEVVNLLGKQQEVLAALLEKFQACKTSIEQDGILAARNGR